MSNQPDFKSKQKSFLQAFDHHQDKISTLLIKTFGKDIPFERKTSYLFMG
jgi:hypothetical protein